MSRNVWKGSPLRLCLTVLVTVLALTATTGLRSAAAAPARGVAGASASDVIILPPDELHLVQEFAAGDYYPTGEQVAGLRSLETVAVDTVIRRHGLEVSDQERSRVLLWNRPEVRVELMSLIMVAGRKAPASRSSAEVAALSWFADVQQRRNVRVAQAAIDEYKALMGTSAYTPNIPQFACSYTPPAPYQSDYPVNGKRFKGCYGGRVTPQDGPPVLPTAEDFTKWGTARVTNAEYSGAATYLEVAAAGIGIAIGAAAGTVAVPLAALAALPASAGFALLGALTPFSATPAITTAGLSVLGYGLEAGLSGFAAGGGISFVSVVAIAAVAVAAIAVLIAGIITVVQNANVGRQLDDSLAKARSTAVTDFGYIFGTSEGVTTLSHAVTALTVERDIESFAGGVPLPSGGPILEVTGAFGAPAGPQRTRSLGYLSVDPASELNQSQTTNFTGGWWLDTATDPSRRTLPAPGIAAYLRDPDPVVSGGVQTDRPIFSSPARITTLKQSLDGPLRFLVTWPEAGVRPPAGGTCADPTSGCWITDRLLMVEPRRSSPQSVRILPNTVDAFDLAAPTGLSQGQFGALRATRGGSPYTADAAGDPVSVTWDIVSCPLRDGCADRSSGPTWNYTFAVPGTYVVRATATDAFGATTSTTRQVEVLNTPPVVTLDATSLSVTRAQDAVISGTALDHRFAEVEVYVDWGDGTAPTRVDTRRDNGRFTASHRYADLGSYTAKVTASDYRTTSSPSPVSVLVRNAAPTLTVLDQQPSTWQDLQPGTEISLKLKVTDTDAGAPLSVEASWYDGTRLTVPADSDGTLTLRRTVRRGFSPAPGPFPAPLLFVFASDGTPGDGIGVGGSVVDAPPVVTITRFAPARTPGEPSTVTGTVSDPNGSTDLGVSVRWGDGSGETPYTVGPDGTFTATHTYAQAGVYSVSVTGRDAAGASGKQTSIGLFAYLQRAGQDIVSATYLEPPVYGQESVLRVCFDAATAGSFYVALSRTQGPGDPISYPAGRSCHDVTLFYTEQTPTNETRVFVAGSPETYAVTDPILVNPAPGLALSPLVGQPGTPVTLPLVYDDLGADVNMVRVDWGDGSAATTSQLGFGTDSVDLPHTYAAVGVYNVTVRLTDGVGNVTEKSTRVTVGQVPPTLSGVTLGGDLREGSELSVSATTTDPEGGPTRLQVDWGDGTTTTTPASTAATRRALRHTYATEGDYRVTVRALNSRGQTSTGQVLTPAVADAPPVVSVTTQESVLEGHLLRTTATVTDPGVGDAGFATINWGDGTSTTRLPWSTEAGVLKATHVYADGTDTARRITVTARQTGGGTGVGRDSVVVRNAKPRLALGPTWATVPGGASQTVPVGAVASGTIVVSDRGAGDTLTGTVDWGDGDAEPVDFLDGSAEPSHTYRTGGRRTIRFAVTDDDGAEVVRSRFVVVVPAAERLAFLRAALATLARASRGTVSARLSEALAAFDGSSGAVSALAAGDRLTTVTRISEAVAHVQAALDAGAPDGARRSARELVVLARALVHLAALAADPATQRPDDTERALATSDALLRSGDLVGAAGLVVDALGRLDPPATTP